MQPRSRMPQIVLVVGLLGVIGGVPLGQVALELHRGERAQFTDLFRYAPSERNLRRYERTLEQKWFGSQTVRPWTQWLLFRLFGDMGAKGLMGREGWVFYRPGVRYLVEHGRAETGAAARRPRFGAAVDAIVRFRDQLRGRGVHLLVVPAPGKASVHADRLTAREAGARGTFRSPTEDLLAELGRRGVASVDLFSLFRERRSLAPSGGALYLACDTHWRPAGAALAAEAAADKLRALGWAPKPQREYRTRRVRVVRRGDVPQMLRVPGISDAFPAETVPCEQVLDEAAGPMVPHPGAPSGTYSSDHLKDTPLESSVLVLGDSFCRIYQTREPRSLGRVAGQAGGTHPAGKRAARGGTRRLLPGSAGFCSLLARSLRAPVDYVIDDGGAATAVRQKLSTNAEILENKKVVVWEFAERELSLGREGWRDVPLPPEPPGRPPR
jgi:hypothetical protein